MQEMQAVWAWPLDWEDPLEGAWPPTPVFWGFPGGSAGKEFVCNVGDLGSIPGLGRSPGGGHGHPLQYSGASLGAQMVKNLPAMWETWVRSLGWEDPLEEGMATHCSILAWRILMDSHEDSHGLQSMGVTKSGTWLSDWAQHNTAYDSKVHARTHCRLRPPS